MRVCGMASFGDIDFFRFEVARLLEVGNESRPGWAPSQPLLCLHARTDAALAYAAELTRGAW